MQCELCGKDLSEGQMECSTCSGPEILGKVQKIIGETIHFLSRSVKVEKGQGDLYFRIGNFHRLSGSFNEAVACYEHALQDRQDKPQYHHMLGTALAGRGDFGGAVEKMKKSVELAPKYPDYRNDLGAAYFRCGKYDEAIAEFNEALKLNPHYANAHNNLAMAYRKKKMFKEAEVEIRKAIELDPGHAIGGDYELGLSYYSGGMFSQLKGGPMRIDAKSLGDIYFFHEKYEEALAQYQKAVQIHPQYPDFQYAVGTSYLALNQNEEAKKAFQKALEINPNYQQAKEALETLNRKISGGSDG